MNINDLEKRYRYWREQVAKGKDERHGIVFGYKHDKNAFAAWERELCEAFLTFSDEDRKRLREIVCDQDVLWLLNGYPLLLSKEIKAAADKDVVMLGLVALVIVDGRAELREADHALRKLFAAASQAGINLGGLLARAEVIAVSEATRRWLAEWSNHAE